MAFRWTLDRVRRTTGALIRSGLVCVSLLAAAGCGDDAPEIPLATVGADRVLFERGTAALEEGDWRRAREYFLQIRDNYPQSPLRADARLGMGDTLEAEGTIEAYISALSEFRDFLALYPTHERADYAQYKLGMIYFRQMRSPERDQSDTRNAITEFEVFAQRYPDSELMDDVQERLREARDRLSEADYIVGKFYHQRKWYPGAIDRLESILAKDPGFTGRDAVYFHLADSLRHTDRRAEALPLFERLLKEFPESEFAEEAQEIVPELREQAAAAAETTPAASEDDVGQP